jgi:FixJ family two-component response regulator
VAQPNIFVIDDDASVRKALERLIRTAGMAVKSFPGAEAFLQANAPLPDCLVLDVRMPVMSGLELQQRLIAEGRRVPIVFISAHEDAQARQSALAAGTADFLQKPFEDHMLLDAIKQALLQRSQPGSLN